MEDAARDGPCAHGKEFSNHLIQLLSASLLSFSQVKPKRRDAHVRAARTGRLAHTVAVLTAYVRSRRARAVRAKLKCSRPCSSALEQEILIVDADARCSICIKKMLLRMTGNAHMNVRASDKRA